MSAAFALWALLAVHAGAAGDIVGFNVPAWGTQAYDQPAAAAAIAALPATGARWAAVTPTWYVDSVRADRIRPTERTPSDESLRATIRKLKALGLKVALKPHVDVEDGTARAQIRPRHIADWFSDYRELSRHYALMARDEGVDMYVVGTELSLVASPLHARRWDALIAELRGLYPGPMTYAANWYDAPAIPFWRRLDYVGIDAYYPLPGGGSVKSLRRAWLLYEPSIAALALLTGKPVLFTETGLCSQQGANRRPWNYRDFGPLDLGVQQRYLQAMLETFQDKKWFAGVWYWAWDVYGRGGPQDKSMAVQGKPALDVLERYFKTGRAEPLAGLPLAAPAARVGALASPRFN